MGRKAFQEIVAQQFRYAGKTITTVDVEGFLLKDNAGNAYFLENLFGQIKGLQDEEVKTKIQHFVTAQTSEVSFPDTYDAARSFLMPIVRQENYVSLITLQTDAEFEQFRPITARRFAPGISVLLAFDSENSMTILDADQLKAWNVSFGDVLSDALENLRKKSDYGGLQWDDNQVLIGSWDDSYESSRVLLPELLQSIFCKGNVVVFLPTRNTFWICGDQEHQLTDLIARLEDAHFSSYPLSVTPLVFKDDCLQDFIPELSQHRLSLNNLKQRRRALDYDQQKEYLEKLLERKKQDVFVASCTTLEKLDTSSIYSQAVWSRGIPTLLPEVDVVRLYDDAKPENRLTVPWASLVSICGPLLVPHGKLRPPRYFVSDFPSQEQLEFLKASVLL